MAMALSAAHNLVPPHPGPVAAAQLLGADLGRITLYGTILSAIMAVLGGRVFGGWIAKRMYVPVPEIALANSMGVKSANPPSVPVIIFILVVPVFLIFAGTAFGMAKLPGAEAIAFIGHPFTALMVAAGAAIYFFGVRRGMNREQILKLTTDALIPTGTLLAIIGSGGALKQVIVESGVGPYAGKMMASAGLSPIIVAFFISAALRFATGSATVAIITAAGIMAPILKSLSGCSPEMIVLAICDGGVMFSHVNDAGFWMVNNYYGMTVSQTLRTWTVMRMVTAMAGLALILACQAVFG